MRIVFPTDCDHKEDFDLDTITLVPIDDALSWIYFEMIDGKPSEPIIYKEWQQIEDGFDIVIVKNQNEYIWPFMEQGIAILVAPMQRYFEDIVEAYIFKELYDVTI